MWLGDVQLHQEKIIAIYFSEIITENTIYRVYVSKLIYDITYPSLPVRQDAHEVE